MSNGTVKLIARYLVLVFFMYLANMIVQPGYANSIKDIGEIAVSAIYTSVFGVLGWVVKSNWSTAPSKDNQ